MKIQNKYMIGAMFASSLLYACGGSGGSTEEIPDSEPSPANGELSLNIVGLPDGTTSTISISGPNGFSSSIDGTTLLSDLTPGSYTVTTNPVLIDNIEFDVMPATFTLNVSANNTAVQELVYMTDVTSQGVISNFGSVYVNGVRYSTDDVSVETDDSSDASEDDLKVGMLISVKGRQTYDRSISSASNISHYSKVEGPLDAISLADNQLTVFGQVYQLNSQTRFENTTLVSLQVGDVVEINAIQNGDDSWLATYVELENGQDSFKLKGELSSLDQTAQTFAIGSVVVDYSQAEVESELANGLFVKVESNQGTVDGVLLADKVEMDDSNDDSDSELIELDGVITEVFENGFSLGGRLVNWSQSTNFVAGTSAELAIGARVKVKGVRTDNGISADRIRFDREGEIEIEGLLQAVNLDTNTITILDTEFVVDEYSQLKDDSDLDIRRFRLDQLNVGDLLEVEAFPSGDMLVVKKLEREEAAGESDNDSGEVKLKGSVVAIDGTTLQLQGVTVTTGQFTEFELGDSDVSSDTFFAQLVVGDWIEVEGIMQADGSVLATEIETSSSNGDNGDDESGNVEFEGIITDFISIESFTVNGRLVTTNERTIFRAMADSMLANGVRVEIYGREAENGDILATRVKIEDMDDNDDYDIEIKGILDADAANGMIVINDQEIMFDESTLFSNGSAANLLQGALVEVQATINANGQLFATEIEFDDNDEQSDVDIEGVITELLDNGELVVAGVTIVITDNTVFENGNSDRLEVGLYVEVEGHFNDEQKLIADEIEIGETESDDLEGSIGQILSDNQFTLGNITVQHDRFTIFEDGTVEDIVAGAEVEIEGFINENNIFMAEKIEFSDD